MAQSGGNLLQEVYQGGHYQKDRKQVWVRTWRNWNLCALLVGVEKGAAAIENRMEVLQKITGKTTL